MNIQWYPGHMTKARRAMQEDIKLIDLVIELVDARVPFSSRNPDIDKLAAGKARMVLLNKADLADETETRKWAQMFEDMGIHVVKIDARNKGTLKQVQTAQQEACKEKIERDRRRGILNRPIRTMVVGIPNVGKSTFINSFAGKACAKTGNKPGVTKGNQWIRLNKTLELLDTPGILWPRFEDQQVGLHLALIGSINDQILNKDELACELISLLEKDYPQVIKERFGIENVEEDRVKVLEEIARSRSCLMKGGELDLARASALLLDDFRAGKLGHISLEKAQDYKDRIKVKEMARELKGEKLEKELLRLEEMKAYEKENARYELICGIDEAGRGPLAGPVAAGAVILPKDCRILYLNDSKKLSEKRREELFLEIKEKALAWSVGIATPQRIDEINILQATYEAMREAIKGLGVEPGLLLNDAVTIPGVEIPQIPIVKGDAKSVSIAAASILAKVTRDHMMAEYDEIYPGYGFGKHKGYGTKAHIEALKELGPCPIHRRSFIGHFVEV